MLASEPFSVPRASPVPRQHSTSPGPDYSRFTASDPPLHQFSRVRFARRRFPSPTSVIGADQKHCPVVLEAAASTSGGMLSLSVDVDERS